MKALTGVTVSKALIMDNQTTLRKVEIALNIAAFVVIFVIGSLTNLIYFPEYTSAQVNIKPKNDFVMEARINGDLFRTSEADFMFTPASEGIFLSNKINKTMQRVFYCPGFNCEQACVNFPNQNLVIFR